MEIRNCKHCGKQFKAKKSQIDSGCGNYCSHRCAYDAKGKYHLTSKENLEKAAAARRESIAKNGTKHKSGKDHPSWKGGPAAARQRRKEQNLEYMRKYRAEHPEMMRESSAKRRGIGRLPRGTVKLIGQAQKWRCAVCMTDITSRYHLDHIMPLALGGEHAPNNLQLLCAPCNVRKSAKHPVDFMQSRGFLC